MNQRDSSQSKTEPPTRKRLKDLREKGQVARSPDVSATAAVIAGVAFLFLGGGYLIERLGSALERAVSLDFNAFGESFSLVQLTRAFLLDAAWTILPLVLVLLAAGTLAGFLQVGPVFSMEQVKAQLSRVNPIEGLKRVFSRRTLVELLKLIVKAAALGVVIWLAVRSALPALLASHWLPTGGILPLALMLFSVLAWSAVACFIAIAAFDLWFQRWDFERRNRMSLEEVRRELKEAEGDPRVRGRRRQLHREVGEASMLSEVRKSDVVIVNPTHIAVALYYEPGETELPLVVAKGEGHLAQAIRRIAEQEGIPILHNVDLARRLKADAPLNQYIPEELIEPVAEVLRWARSLERP